MKFELKHRQEKAGRTRTAHYVWGNSSLSFQNLELA